MDDKPQVDPNMEKLASDRDNMQLACAWISYLTDKHPDKEYLFAPGFEFDDFDYFISENQKLHHLLEVKVRRNSFEQYDQIILPLRKYEFAKHLLGALKVFFLCEWACGTRGWIDLAETPDRVEDITREDRQVTKPHAFYKRSRFKIIGG